MRGILADENLLNEERFQMDYTPKKVRNASAEWMDLLVIPNTMTDYVNTGTEITLTSEGKDLNS